ncbi:MAG TPA: methionyl-tRNA formyltransferase [Candidatus Atribacteria bacterium]|nr:methionyl-tRNA formyltransferase [Candidatus Atribacteria bacterium]HCU22280.1 methionyl-tRNA formyltransferase [Candidatus Atribacteria bacterium]
MTKVVFLGTTSLSIGVLRSLFDAQYNIAAVITQPDRECGRGRRLTPPPVKVWSQDHGFNVLQPDKVNRKDFLEVMNDIAPDVMIVAAYGQILRSSLLEIAPFGCINVHASLLPRYRGADPIRWAILNGEKKTGVSIMLMDEGIDTGPVLAVREVEIESSDDCNALEKKLGEIGGDLLVEILPDWIAGKIKPIPQSDDRASYAGKIPKDLYQINWDRSAEEIVRQIRAFAPCPGAFGYFHQKRLKIIKAHVYKQEEKVKAGQIIRYEPNVGLLVGTGRGILAIEELHPENRNLQSGQEFCCGYRIQPGDEFY